jgi:NADH-quinone oxidoreductase subunit M
VLKGTVANAPAITYLFLFGILAIVGFPLTSGFIADILLFIGAFQAFGLYGLLPLIGLVIIGSYMYYVMDRSMLSSREQSQLVDFESRWQKAGLALFALLIIVFGVLPFVLLNLKL